LASFGRFRAILLLVTAAALGFGFYMTAGGFDRIALDLEAQSVDHLLPPGTESPAIYVKAIERVGWEPSLVEVRK